jgi:hypothetical protein
MRKFIALKRLYNLPHEVRESNGEMNQRGKKEEKVIEKGIEKGRIENRTLQM